MPLVVQNLRCPATYTCVHMSCNGALMRGHGVPAPAQVVVSEKEQLVGRANMQVRGGQLASLNTLLHMAWRHTLCMYTCSTGIPPGAHVPISVIFST